MAPKKLASDDRNTSRTTSDTASVNNARVTRRSSRLGNRTSAKDSAARAPAVSPKKKKAKRASKDDVKSDEVETVEMTAEVAKTVEMATEVAKTVEITGAEAKTVVIEHCKQCNSFKTRAVQVKEGLENGVSGITVLVNPDKPRRGCFEIREEGGEKFISLQDMKRPFLAMKALDINEVIADIIDKIK